MTERFEVGQKVRHDSHGEVEVTYGPFVGAFGGTRYLIRTDSGREVTVSPHTLAAIPEPPKFAIGDKVTAVGSEGALVAGPFVSKWTGTTFWVVEHADGRYSAPLEEALTKAADEPIKVGDRVRVVKDSDGYRAGEYVGLVGVVAEITPSDDLPYKVRFGDGSGEHGNSVNGYWFCAEVERITDEDTYEYAGVTYDLRARYRDREGDVWTFKRWTDGEVRGTWVGTINDYSARLGEVVTDFGPLTRVTD